MSTTKHPKIYGQRGFEAWGELWDALGPALNSIYKGDTVHKNDGEPTATFPLLVFILLVDLLFFDRLGPDMLPEEVYHSWYGTSRIRVCLAHFHLGHGFPFTRMMETFKDVSTPHSSLLKAF